MSEQLHSRLFGPYGQRSHHGTAATEPVLGSRPPGAPGAQRIATEPARRAFWSRQPQTVNQAGLPASFPTCPTHPAVQLSGFQLYLGDKSHENI